MRTVAAVIDYCPACDARDAQAKRLSDSKNHSGEFVRWAVCSTEEARMTASVWATNTADGAQARKAWERRPRPADD